MEIIRNLTEAMLGSGNGIFGHFGDLFGAGLLGTVHSVMTAYYESTLGGGAGSGAPYSGSSHGGNAPDFSEVFGNEFDLPPSEQTTLADVLAAGERVTLADVVASAS